EECSGTQTTIRERVGWLIPNQHMQIPEVFVELQFDSPQGAHVIRRHLTKPAKKRSLGAGLDLTFPDGEMVTGKEAENRLGRLLNCSFRDFMTTVYQHQEVIRGIVTPEPRERNDAIDRLLGLSEFRNLLSGINDANPQRWQKGSITKEFEAFEDQVQTVLKTREQDLNEKRQEATGGGAPKNRPTGKTAVTEAGEVHGMLVAFAKEAGIELGPLDVPEEWKGLDNFEKSAKKLIARLRGELPLAKEQEDLFTRRNEVIRLKTDLESAK